MPMDEDSAGGVALAEQLKFSKIYFVFARKCSLA